MACRWGPVITPQSKERVESLIGVGEKQGAKVLLDGRNARIPKSERGNFVKPTILDDVPVTSEITDTEIFGPVLSLVHADNMDEALAFLERSAYGNQASAVPRRAARRLAAFRYEGRLPQATSASTSEWPLPWRTFRLADGRTASSAISTARDAMRSSSIPTRKLLSSAGRKSTRGSSRTSRHGLTRINADRT